MMMNPLSDGGSRKRRPSIVPTNVPGTVDTEDWVYSAKRCDTNLYKAKYPGFFARVKQRTFAPYVFNQSIEAAQINKHLFELVKSEKMNIVWPSVQEEKRARRKLPVPVSLTGFGLDDGKSAKYWTHRLKLAVDRAESGLQELEADDFMDKIPPSVQAVIADSEDNLSADQKQLKEWFEEAKELKELKKQNHVEVIPDDVKFPYKMAEQLRYRLQEEIEDMKNTGVQEVFEKETRVDLLDKEYEEYMKHRKLLSLVSSDLSKGVSSVCGKISGEEMDSEMEAWRESFWRRSYGSSNPSIPPSKVPCGGCGAQMHCTDPAIPGYLPSEKFVLMKESDLKREKCQRCDFLEHFNVSVDVTVNPEAYPEILSKIKDNRAMVIIMVDLLDFPCSIWPDVIPLIGKHRKIFVVGNKVDLLPRDGQNYLERIEMALKKSLTKAGVDASQDIHIRDLCLISAKTGYGVESLITKLYKAWNRKDDIYLLGCTNVGKSTLFNALLQSDLCAARENDLIQRATTSLWPGTTLNLLKFPIHKMEGWQLELRKNRLDYETRVKAEEYELRRSLWKQDENPTLENILNRIGMTFRDEVPFTKESNHPFAKRSLLPKPFDENDYRFLDSSFFYDSPGTIYKDQMLSLLTTEELLKVIPRKIITPRTFSLQPYQSLFIAGLARLDVIHSRQNVLVTVFASEYLPIHVVYTKEASRFYNIFLGTDLLAVPFGSTERLNQFPILLPKEVDFTEEDTRETFWKESCGDIVLSSAGWVSITMGQQESCVIKAFTPDAKGIFVRKPSLLPFAVNMKGRRVIGTPCYESKRVTIDHYDVEERQDDSWKQQKPHRRESSYKNAINSFKIRQNNF